jgi:hypothetical protein
LLVTGPLASELPQSFSNSFVNTECKTISLLHWNAARYIKCIGQLFPAEPISVSTTHFDGRLYLFHTTAEEAE